MRTLIQRAILLLLGLAVGLALAEGLARLRGPAAGLASATEKFEFRDGGRRTARAYTIDDEIGFRPVLDGHPYTATGTLANEYPLEKRPGVRRVLFIGDSVTAQGLLVAHLRRVYGDVHLEYWNAGVHSFNTTQEVKYYRRYNAAIHPDHVILVFHNNDFETTPVAFTDEGGRLTVYTPKRSTRGVARWLFQHSQLYRLACALAVPDRTGSDGVVEETRASLAELKELLERDHVRFSVVLLPLLKPYVEWSPAEKASRASSLRIFDELHLRYVDLFPALDAALAVTPPRHQDFWHPVDAAAETFAGYLAGQDLLARDASPQGAQER